MHLGDLTGVSQEEARRWRRVALVLFLIAGLGGPAGQTVDAAQAAMTSPGLAVFPSSWSDHRGESL